MSDVEKETNCQVYRVTHAVMVELIYALEAADAYTRANMAHELRKRLVEAKVPMREDLTELFTRINKAINEIHDESQYSGWHQIAENIKKEVGCLKDKLSGGQVK